jgi:hypothetical protein
LNDVNKETTTQAVETTPHINERKGATLVPCTVKLLHHEKENPMGIKRVAAWPETGS